MTEKTANEFSEREALLFHSVGRPGKIEIIASKPMATQRDLSLAYSPGVAVPVKAIADDPAKAYDYTAKGNLVAVISNGTAILGLGNLGALASKPVMEGKAVLFKRFADVDSIDVELATEDPDAIIEAVGESHRVGAGYAYFCVLAGVFITALYSFRLLYMTFHGKERFVVEHVSHSHGHGPPDRVPVRLGPTLAHRAQCLPGRYRRRCGAHGWRYHGLAEVRPALRHRQPGNRQGGRPWPLLGTSCCSQPLRWLRHPFSLNR